MAKTEETGPLYAARPEWKDITPIPQYAENANPIAPIFYTEAYKDATDYFRAVVKAGELSPRVLELTESVIRLNPAHYSAWQYRYKVIVAINSPLAPEHALMNELATNHLKTYQVWHHRRLLLLLAAKRLSESKGEDKDAIALSPETELGFIASVLKKDEKNYHTWAFRQWVLATFFSPLSNLSSTLFSTSPMNEEEASAYRLSMLDDEIAFVESMLHADIRNNSAWNHRFFINFKLGTDVVMKSTHNVAEFDNEEKDIVGRELSYTKEKIALAPNNASAWNYIRGVLELAKIPFSSLTSFVLPYTRSHGQEADDDQIIDLDNPLPSSSSDLPAPPALEFLADIYERDAETLRSAEQSEQATVKEKLQKAIPIWRSLSEDHDVTRKKYWEHRIHIAQITCS
ncbi:protein prenylyltransferase [Schizopora paradoxa]|uniref:Protein farnesyltransferase/geranylgeranyltransferase type-1 subunit alpha n=1 Tax=Schizopora paradoxa TaxID=27342 RepID=A0A0H2RA97_9AGAM|nr:protein prenylyltransferase [Schizopora paradoxa]